jgi:hypothetical protein
MKKKSKAAVTVVKKAHTPKELRESGKRFVESKGPRLTLDEVFDMERVKQTQVAE